MPYGKNYILPLTCQIDLSMGEFFVLLFNREKNLENLRKCRYYSIDIEIDRRQVIDEEIYEVARLWQ